MKLPSLRNLKRIEALLGIARHIVFILLMFAPLSFHDQRPSSPSISASVLTGTAGWLAA
jgi:hypothetical protein